MQGYGYHGLNVCSSSCHFATQRSQSPTPSSNLGASISSMAPTSNNAEKLPKSVLQVREIMGDLQITAKSLYDNVDSKLLNNLATTFRKAQSEQCRSDYNDQTPEVRREWLAQYVLDPKTGSSIGFSSTTAHNSQSSEGLTEWLTEDQLASSQWLNSESHAHTLCQSGELRERPHERPCLAKAGVKQYEYSRQQLLASTGWCKKSGVKTTSELKPEESNEVASHIESNFGSSATKKRKITPKPTQENESQKLLKASRARRTTLLRKLKTQIDKATNDTAGWFEDVDKLGEKEYPNAMLEFYRNKIALVKEAATKAQTYYERLRNRTCRTTSRTSRRAPRPQTST